MTKIKKLTNSKEFEFYQNYAKYVVPKLKGLETERKKNLWTNIGLTIGTIVILYIFFIVVLRVPPLKEIHSFLDFLFIYTMPIWVIIPIAIFPIYFIWKNSLKVFNAELKKKCMPELLKAFGEISWKPNDTVISDSEISKSELFGIYNNRTNDDTFSGYYKDLHFVVSESELLNVRGSGKNRSVWPVFDGVIVYIDSNKTIKNKTIITTKGDINVKNSDPLILISAISLPIYLFANGLPLWSVIFILLIGLLIWGVVKAFSNRKQEEILDRMILEDPEFNNKYNVYSSDQIEGRYLVTTAFMERFKTLHTAFGSNKAKCAFFDDKVMFAVSTNKNLFEIGDLFHPLTDMKHINDFMKEISAIYEIIDYFKLAEKTGL